MIRNTGKSCPSNCDMFLMLNKRGSDCVDCDEFGWWLTGPEAKNFQDDPNDRNSFLVVQEADAEVPTLKSDALQVPGWEKNGDDDSGEICFAEEPPCETSCRSYTPERLVRTQDYAILSPSPTFSTISQTGHNHTTKRHRPLSHLIDCKLVGASHLQEIFDTEVDLPLAAAARRKTSKGRNAGSPAGTLTPDLISSGSSYELLDSVRRPAIAECDSTRIEKFRESKKALGSHGEEILRGEVPTGDPEPEEDPKIFVQQIRGRIDDISHVNKDIFGEVYTLRKNFQWAETKTGDLTTETIRLRREIRDLRYLDDLVNLLRGELERISQRNWPFNIGHADHHAEEVNLVV